ncbi:MAG: PD-(D/E)XK nuclease family protein [Aquaticitalea sp.]
MIIHPNLLQHLLSDTGRIVRHHKKLSIAKGEHFNIFSVLKIESRENNTHSAFLAELLDPKGSHRMGDVFLRLFFQTINTKQEVKDLLFERFINSTKTKVTKEFHIGKRSDEDLEGGRIDIFLKNGDHCICIENKIYAPDQNVQIQRYCNYNPTKNTVFYLTLKGDEPNDDSRGELKSDTDYYNLSYKKNIIEWLELCLKEVANFPSLRESINQYILLIKKLTHTLNTEQDKELFDVIIKNIEASRYIVDNYDRMVNRLKNRFRDDLKVALETHFKEGPYDIRYDKKVENKYSQLWIHFKSNPQPQILFGIEPFSGQGHKDGHLFIGLYDKERSPFLKDVKEENKLSEQWRHVRYFKTDKGNPINFSHDYTIKKLADKDGYKDYLQLISNTIIEFVEDYKKMLPAILFEERSQTINDESK